MEVSLQPANNERLANLCGQFDEHLRQIESHLGVVIHSRGHNFRIQGELEASKSASLIIKNLYAATESELLSPDKVHLSLQQAGAEQPDAQDTGSSAELVIRTRRVMVKPKGKHQLDYVKCIQSSDLSFGVGPAGTGKTYLAVACAVEALESERVRRLVLVRPAVEAGERLGFLPGDMVAKVDPYLRPIYDALYEFLGFERVAKLIDRNVIEVAPLAFMRGRTLNHSFIIMDEAQNTTLEQMKMFLTRIGYGSSAVVTGDVTQIDLPKHTGSGLKHVLKVLAGVEGVAFTNFDSRDVVRHALVQRIIDAYDHADSNKEQASDG